MAARNEKDRERGRAVVGGGGSTDGTDLPGKQAQADVASGGPVSVDLPLLPPRRSARDRCRPISLATWGSPVRNGEPWARPDLRCRGSRPLKEERGERGGRPATRSRRGDPVLPLGPFVVGSARPLSFFSSSARGPYRQTCRAPMRSERRHPDVPDARCGAREEAQEESAVDSAARLSNDRTAEPETKLRVPCPTSSRGLETL